VFGCVPEFLTQWPERSGQYSNRDRGNVKLIINRSQQAVKGMSFTLGYRLELTPDEEGLVEQYRLTEYPLTWRVVAGDRLPTTRSAA
jgi:hypothetical protein